MIWYKDKNDNDIVVSTRVRLARNLDNYPFPSALGDDAAKKLSEEVKNAILSSNSTLSKDFEWIKMENISKSERRELSEAHLISPQMAQSERGSFFKSSDETMSIMLFEEDHIRLQIIKSGLCLSEAWELADKVDNVLEESLSYAFSEEFGYLTSCPTNTGTGMRASVMMHLPALTITNNINKITSSASALGMTVRGLYGEGSKAYGNLYQVSNQVTLGISEEEIISGLENVVSQIEKHETDARKALKQNDGLADRLWRSYGTLKFARSVSSSEAKALLSDVILGRKLGIIDIEEKNPPIRLMVETEPALIMKKQNMSPEERDKKRAQILREGI